MRGPIELFQRNRCNLQIHSIVFRKLWNGRIKNLHNINLQNGQAIHAHIFRKGLFVEKEDRKDFKSSDHQALIRKKLIAFE
jgi:endonuclease/exonuclease/phosphatase (EEP) superfamily protein YafD